MTDESTMKLTDFDYLIGDHHLQMVKAAIPYVNVTQQRFLSLFVKLRELQRTVSLFREEQVGAMGICSPSDGAKGSPLEIMKAIRPYGNTQEQDLIDMLCNFLSGPRMGGQYPDIVAAQAPSNDMMDDIPPTEIVPDRVQPPVYGTKQPFAELPPYHAASVPPAPGVETAGSAVPSPDSVQTGAHPSNLRSMPASIEQIKSFLPPDQQARLEQAAFVLQALQQFT